MPIPKSLHTVRVFTVMAQQYIEQDNSLTCAQAVDMAAEALGYHPAGDEYGLIAKAVAQLEKGA